MYVDLLGRHKVWKCNLKLNHDPNFGEFVLGFELYILNWKPFKDNCKVKVRWSSEDERGS
jgi:hypothetical protein